MYFVEMLALTLTINKIIIKLVIKTYDNFCQKHLRFKMFYVWFDNQLFYN